MKKVFENALKQAGPHVKKGAGSPPPGSTRALLTLGVAGFLGFGLYNSLWTVDGGHRGVMFDRIGGVEDFIYGEGMHMRVPWFQRPTTFDIRAKPFSFRSPTGTKDLQTVDVKLRVLFRPSETHLPQIYKTMGTGFADRILPSLVTETLKSVIAQFNANQLITQRDNVSGHIRRNLQERAGEFNILIDDVSITHLTFSPAFAAAIEAKQVATQEAERAKYLVKQAEQEKKSTILRAQAEAEGAELIGQAMRENPGYIELRQLEASKEIATKLAQSRNKLYLDANSLLLNILQTDSSAQRLQAHDRVK